MKPTFPVDTEVLTPAGKGTVMRIDGSQYLINLHAKPGLGPFRYSAKEITRAPSSSQDRV